jgi:hypothetical protein
MHSRESLHRLPGYIEKIPVASYIIEREIGKLHLYTGRIVDFRRIYWTPPLSPREALELETSQIERQLGLSALVSLTDHDSVEAGLHLRMLPDLASEPVSTEWSVPFRQTVFHLGVHNLPAPRAAEWMQRLAVHTKASDPKRLRALLQELNDEPDVLVVLNHPYWDAESGLKEEHAACLRAFLEGYGTLVHALEWNGLRSLRENNQVMRLAEQSGHPVISGGDRHGCEPNATLNVTAAKTFAEFVQEIRVDRQSHMVLMPQYFESLRIRLLESSYHALCDAPGEFGRSHWMSRVFVEDTDGTARPLSQFTGTRFHRVVDKFRWVMKFLSSPQVRPALRLTFFGGEDEGL